MYESLEAGVDLPALDREVLARWAATDSVSISGCPKWSSARCVRWPPHRPSSDYVTEYWHPTRCSPEADPAAQGGRDFPVYLRR